MTSAELITELQATRPAADGAAARPRPGDRRRRAGAAVVSLRATLTLLAAAVRARRRAGDGRRAPRRGRGRRPARLRARSRRAWRRSRERPPLAERNRPGRPRPTRQAPPQLKAGTGAADAATPAPTTGRAQRYSAQLTLSVKDIDALSDATQQALRITRDLGGYLVTASYATSDSGTSVADAEGADRERAGRDRAALGSRQDRRPAGADRRPPGTGRRADEARDGSARADRAALGAARRAPTSTRRRGRRSRRAATPPAASSRRCGSPSAQVNAEARYATIQLTLQTPQSSVVRPRPVALRQRGRPCRRDPRGRGDGRALRARHRRAARCSSRSSSGSPGAGCAGGRTSTSCRARRRRRRSGSYDSGQSARQPGQLRDRVCDRLESTPVRLVLLQDQPLDARGGRRDHEAHRSPPRRRRAERAPGRRRLLRSLTWTRGARRPLARGPPNGSAPAYHTQPRSSSRKSVCRRDIKQPVEPRSCRRRARRARRRGCGTRDEARALLLAPPPRESEPERRLRRRRSQEARSRRRRACRYRGSVAPRQAPRSRSRWTAATHGGCRLRDRSRRAS